MSLSNYIPLIAVMGPQGSGKSTLLKSLIQTPQTEAARQNGGIRFEGLFGMNLIRNPQDRSLFLDCPGHPESMDEALAWASCADLSLVVVDSIPSELYRAAPILAALAKAKKPHCVFVNKVDSEKGNLDATISALQDLCAEPLLIQQLPLHDLTGRINGSVHLWNETATVFLKGGGEKSTSIPPEEEMEEAIAREEFLESLADIDDRLLASLLEDRLPTIRMLADDLKEGVKQDHFVPVFFGSASLGYGLMGLRETLGQMINRHNQQLLGRIGVDIGGTPLAVVLQNGEITKRGFAAAYRVLRGPIKKGMVLSEQRLSSIFVQSSCSFGTLEETDTIQAGDVMFALKVEPLVRGSLLGVNLSDPEIPGAQGIPLMSLGTSNYVQAVHLKSSPSESGTERTGSAEFLRDKHSLTDRDTSRLTQALDRLSTENPCIIRKLASRDPQEILILSQGPAQLDALRLALANRFGLAVTFSDPSVAYLERIKSSFQQVHGRFKHQTGGHGAFGDVLFDFCPLSPGSGIHFENEIVGGTIPKTFIPAIEEGLHEALLRGRQGYPLTDMNISLIDGQTHSVDSSEMAFRHAARLAVQTLLEVAETELLEPYVKVNLEIPEVFDSQVMQQAAALQGQIQEFSMAERFPDASWNTVTLILPEGRLPELVRQSKRLTQGLALVTLLNLSEREKYRPVMQPTGH